MYNKLILLLSVLFFTIGCNSYKTIPPDYIGVMLTPTGYGKEIYSPGQVDVGDLSTGNLGNTLVLIQSSGVDAKESFSVTPEGDHRCLIGDQTQISLDVRVVLALPDYKTPEGLKELHRVLALGKAEKWKDGDKTDDRIILITTTSVYDQQARQQVRESIRVLCTTYKDFDSIFAAFSDSGPNGLSKKIENIVREALNGKKVPLGLVSAGPSNLKPDDNIMQARASKQAADTKIAAVKQISDFLDGDRTGSRRFVYMMQEWERIVSIGNVNGHNTILMNSGNAQGSIISLPSTTQAPPQPAAAPAAEKKDDKK